MRFLKRLSLNDYEVFKVKEREKDVKLLIFFIVSDHYQSNRTKLYLNKFIYYKLIYILQIDEIIFIS